MQLFSRIRKYRVYRRMVLSYLLLIILSITMVSTILYSLFSAKAVKEIDDSSKQMLSQVSYTANVVYKQIQDVMSQLLVDPSIDAFMSAEDANKVTTYKAYLIIAKVKSVYPFITNISLYNFINDEYTDTSGLPRDPKVAAPANRQFINFYPRQTRKNESAVLNLLTFRIVKEWQPVTNVPKAALVIDLDESYIQKTIGSIHSSTDNADTFVMDASGQVLSHTESQYFMKDFSKRPYLQRILNDKENQGSYIQTLNHHKNLITYVRSSTLDWFFVTVRPYDELLTDIYVLRNWTLAVALLLIVLGAAASLLLSGNIYNPIRALVDRVMEKQGTGNMKEALLTGDEYTLLSQAFMKTYETAKMQETILARSKQILKSSTIVTMLKGADQSTMADIEREWGDRMRGPVFTVILFKIDAWRSFKESYSAIDRELICYAIGNIAQEQFGASHESQAAVMEDEVAVIVQSDHQAGDSLPLTLSEIQDTIQAYYKITVSVSIGDGCGQIADIRRSYRSAQRYIAYRLFFGRSCIVDAERILQGRETEMRYPSSKERKIIEAVKLCSKKSIRIEIDDWIDFISRCAYTQAIQYTNYLFLSMIREFEVMSEWRDMDTRSLYTDPFQIQNAETLDELRLLLTDFCYRIVSVLEEYTHNVSQLKNMKLVEEVKRLIAEQFADANLSLDYAAAQVGLSAGYVGKLFKSHVQTTFNDYVAAVRIEQAMQLLSATNDMVADIAAKVGIPGVPYFSTLFKKHVGMSPSQYRDHQKTQAQ